MATSVTTVPTIEDSVPRSPDDGEFPLAPFEERYFTRYDHREESDESGSGDQCVLIHSNRICLICLASEHPVVKNKMEIEKINFQARHNTLIVFAFCSP